MRAVFSHSLRKMQLTEEYSVVSHEVAEKIMETASLPTPMEQADNLIRWLGNNLPGAGEYLRLGDPIPRMSIIGAASERGYEFILQGIKDQELVLDKTSVQRDDRMTLSFKGWAIYEELKKGSPSGNKAFMAMKFGEKELTKMVDDHFRLAVAQTGFVLRNIDDEPKMGPIDDRMRVEIQASRFMVSDLTHDNNGAYWEAGYAEGLRKPVIYTCEEAVFNERSTHFDTNHLQTVLWSLEHPQEAVEKLKASIRATIPEAKKVDD